MAQDLTQDQFETLFALQQQVLSMLCEATGSHGIMLSVGDRLDAVLTEAFQSMLTAPIQPLSALLERE